MASYIKMLKTSLNSEVEQGLSDFINIQAKDHYGSPLVFAQLCSNKTTIHVNGERAADSAYIVQLHNIMHMPNLLW